jgi:3-deoxy-D-manno-octulosonic-acid transferase
MEILERDNTLDFIERFKQNKKCLVAGSTWPEDEKIIINYINEHPDNDVKYIIAPHTLKKSNIEDLKSSINKKTILFSEKEGANLSDYNVLILDTIGILTKVYNYADVAYVGGGVGKTGLHNVLEPAVFGIPVIIGKHYFKFKEAIDLVNMGGIIAIKNKKDFKINLTELFKNESLKTQIGNINKNYINKNKGAKVKIFCKIRKLL